MIYLTTNMQLDHSNFLNSAANTILSPVHYWLEGRSVRIVQNAFQDIPRAGDTSWLRTAFMVAALIPSLILGSAVRLISLLDSQVQRAFIILQTPPAPAPIDPNHLPVGYVVDKNIAYLKQLIEQPDNTLKAWLDKKETGVDYRDVLEGTSVLASTREVFVHELTEEQLTQLTELCGQAIQKLQKNGLLDSVQIVDASQKAEPKPQPTAVSLSKPPIPAKPVREPGYIPPNTFKLLFTTYSQLSEKNFARLTHDSSFKKLCTELKLDPANVLEKISTQKKVSTIHKLKDYIIEFFMNLQNEDDKNLSEWLHTQKSAPGYIFPFYWGSKVASKQEASFYKFTLGGTYYNDIKTRYEEAHARLTKLELTRFLSDKLE